MRSLSLTITATAALFASDWSAEAMLLGSPASARAVMESLNLIGNAQYFYRGRDYCWYPYGWNGPGWY